MQEQPDYEGDSASEDPHESKPRPFRQMIALTRKYLNRMLKARQATSPPLAATLDPYLMEAMEVDETERKAHTQRVDAPLQEHVEAAQQAAAAAPQPRPRPRRRRQQKGKGGHGKAPAKGKGKGKAKKGGKTGGKGGKHEVHRSHGGTGRVLSTARDLGTASSAHGLQSTQGQGQGQAPGTSSSAHATSTGSTSQLQGQGQAQGASSSAHGSSTSSTLRLQRMASSSGASAAAPRQLQEGLPER